jgi:hypothetical protein
MPADGSADNTLSVVDYSHFHDKENVYLQQFLDICNFSMLILKSIHSTNQARHTLYRQPYGRNALLSLSEFSYRRLTLDAWLSKSLAADNTDTLPLQTEHMGGMETWQIHENIRQADS